MNTRTSLKNRQGGAVAVMVGFSMVLLVGFLAMVIDLGHLYVAKTELQNGADAAALAGAKELNGSVAGVASAVSMAANVASRNNYDFSSESIDITIEDIWVGDCPDPRLVAEGGCMVPADSVTATQAAVATFIKVDTGTRNLTAWFAPIWSIFNVSTFGMAVAGRYTVDVSPSGICQLPDDKTNPNYVHDDAATIATDFYVPPPPHVPPAGYEFGYERGVSYKVSDTNPLGPGTKYWIDPLEMAPTPCVSSNNNVGNSIPYLCTGKMAFTPTVGSIVYTNTGTSTPAFRALDSRFNDYYTGASFCDPATAPPDSNIREYRCTNAAGNNDCLRNPATGIVGLPRNWMNPDPVRQSIAFTTVGGIYQPKPWNTRTFSDYGVLWSANRPVVAASDVTDASVSSRWSTLYQAPSAPAAATSYPQPSPYAQTSGNFFSAPTTNTPKSGRRVLNMAILNCTASGGVCSPMTVLGIGRFFMQTKVNTNNEIYVEFVGLLPTPLPTGDIRLYR